MHVQQMTDTKKTSWRNIALQTGRWLYIIYIKLLLLTTKGLVDWTMKPPPPSSRLREALQSIVMSVKGEGQVSLYIYIHFIHRMAAIWRVPVQVYRRSFPVATVLLFRLYSLFESAGTIFRLSYQATVSR